MDNFGYVRTYYCCFLVVFYSPTIKTKQGIEEIPKSAAICIIGRPLSMDNFKFIKQNERLSDNYGAVFVPHSVLNGIDLTHSLAVVGDTCGCYVVRGLLPTPNLRVCSKLMGYLNMEKEQMIYVNPDELAGLNLN